MFFHSPPASCYQNYNPNQKSILCNSCKCWIHHNNKNNCSGLTNREFKSHPEDETMFWECDLCRSTSSFSLPFYHLDDDNWLNFNQTKKATSKDVNIISANNKKFADQCEHIQN